MSLYLAHYVYSKLGFNLYGIHRNGTLYGEDGFNERNFNKNHIHRNGTLYGEDGYDEQGYDENGFDKHGIFCVTRALFDLGGYDVHGFNKAGINRLGQTRAQAAAFKRRAQALAVWELVAAGRR